MSDVLFDDAPVDVPAVPSPPFEPASADLSPVGGAGSKWAVSLSPWPVYGQLQDWTADARPDENKAHNCLPESLAMSLKYMTGLELPADYIKDVEYGGDYVGDTTYTAAQHFLARYCETESTIWEAHDERGTLWHVWNALKHGWPCIGLFQYGGQAGGVRHCMPYIYLTDTLVKVADPWRAEVLTWDRGTHWNWSLRAGMTLHRTRHVV